MAQWGIVKLTDGREIRVQTDSFVDDGVLNDNEIEGIARRLCQSATKAGVSRSELAASKFRIVEADLLWMRMTVRRGSGAELLLRAKPPILLKDLMTFRF